MNKILRLASFLVTAGCSAGQQGEEVQESANVTALSGSIAVGTELVTTSNVNFREGPATTYRSIRVLSAGTPVVVVAAAPVDKFYNVKLGDVVGWIHGGYVAKHDEPVDAGPGVCVERRLTFSADNFPSLPAAGSSYVWGANATDGDLFIDPPYSSAFVARAAQAHGRGLEVFAYLEGPCGDTDGVDDGERARCANIHNTYNRTYAPGTPNTPQARWKPFTIKQLTTSGALGVDYCEIDNLENNVTIPLNPLLAEIKVLYDTGKIHCRLVLKNVSVSGIDSIRANVAPTPAAASFIAPFHIFEDDDTSKKASLDAAMRRLKGLGAVTIISTDTNHYGAAFTPDKFVACN